MQCKWLAKSTTTIVLVAVMAVHGVMTSRLFPSWGALTDDEAEAIKEHLLSCSQCADLVDRTAAVEPDAETDGKAASVPAAALHETDSADVSNHPASGRAAWKE